MSQEKTPPPDAEHRDATPEAPDPKPGDAGGALVESPEAAVERLTAELGELSERHLRLAAEYDNFRKRTAKERSELWPQAQADLVARLVDALDDLTRVVQLDPAHRDTAGLREGVALVERKLRKQLESVGVQRVDRAGVPFDPTVHEAVTTARADDPARDHTVGAVLQAGYKLGDRLIRPARVQVLTYEGDPD
jgi:molecular chaperone GrpE